MATRPGYVLSGLVVGACLWPLLAQPASLTASFSSIPSGSNINLTSAGPVDWVHWGLYTESSLDRKAGVIPQISDFTLLDNANGSAFVYQFADNFNGYTWSDGNPDTEVTNTTTGVWGYGTPQIDSGFQITAPADTALRTLKVYVGAYGARGRFEAILSDRSAAGYTNTSLLNTANGPSGVYTVNYAAATGGQWITARWTLANPTRPDGNVTLQAAALTSSNANNPPFITLINPTNNTNFSAHSDITLTAAANDVDGTVTNVEFFANDTLVGANTSNPYSITWSNAPPGFHLLTARATDNQGAVSISAPIEVFVSGGGGSLLGGVALPPGLPAAVDLTAEGSRDWAHWGFTANNRFNHKGNVLQQVSDFTKLGTNIVEFYSDNYTGYSWSDGTPTLNANNTTTGVFTSGTTNGFQITVPADTASRTLKVYVGLYGAQGNFQAWLSDFSGPGYGDTTLSNFFGNAYGVYTLTYAAASSGQTLMVRYRALNIFDRNFGNVTLQAATLKVNSTGNLPPDVQLTQPTNGAVLVAPATFTLEAAATDSDGSVSQVEFFNSANSLGADTTEPYTKGVSNLAAGSYVFSAVATDNLGALATNRVTVVVRSPLPSPTILNPALSSGGFGFSVAAESFWTYTVQKTDSLNPVNWQTLTNFAGDGSLVEILDNDNSGSQRFYRMLIE